MKYQKKIVAILVIGLSIVSAVGGVCSCFNTPSVNTGEAPTFEEEVLEPVFEFEWDSSGGYILTGVEKFNNCKHIVVPTLHEGAPVIAIGRRAFKDSSIYSVKISDSVKIIKEEAFQFCSWLESVTIGTSVTTIEKSAFAHCNALQSVVFGSALQRIEQGVFFNTSLTTVKIPSSVNYIGSLAFGSCQELVEAVFENPKGWKTSDVEISQSYLNNTSTAAIYLTNNSSKEWIRQ